MWTRVMIVLGADTHKRSHTLAAINVATGQVLGDRTVQVGPRGLTCFLLCRSSPVGDVRRDLIGAWQRPEQALSAERPASAKQKGCGRGS